MSCEAAARQAGTSGGSGGAVGGFSLAAQLTMLWSSGHHIALSLFLTHMWLPRLFKVIQSITDLLKFSHSQGPQPTCVVS